ncbi:MAG: ATP-binding protein [Candidatus Moranbacteria bacterium]|nr:ATP-binding protein [Candidatus Moranbacteria bacterium]
MDLDDIIRRMRSSHGILYILCGLPYSGKTYAARKILDAVPCVYVSVDDILEALGYDWNAGKLPDEKGWESVMDISYRRTREALWDSKNVLYDSTNHTKISRDELRKVADDAGAGSRVVFVDAPAGVVRRRWEENKTSRKRFVLSEELLDMTIDALEVPGSDEDPWIVARWYDPYPGGGDRAWGGMYPMFFSAFVNGGFIVSLTQ